MKCIAFIAFAACVHAPVQREPPEPVCQLRVYQPVPALGEMQWRRVACSDPELARLREWLPGVTIERSERIPGTGYHHLCVDAPPGACRHTPRSSPVGQVLVSGPLEAGEGRHVVELVSPPRSDDVWLDEARNRLLATGRYREVSLQFGANDELGRARVVIQVEPVASPPSQPQARSAACPDADVCTTDQQQRCWPRRDGCTVCVCAPRDLSQASKDSALRAVLELFARVLAGK